MITYTLRTEYHERLDVFARHLKDLGDAIEVLRAQHVEFVRARQAAVHSYEGYDTPLGRLRTRVGEALGEVNLLMARQGRALELVAIDELVARRERLETYEDQARFALADSYDRATRDRAVAETAALQRRRKRRDARPPTRRRTGAAARCELRDRARQRHARGAATACSPTSQRSRSRTRSISRCRATAATSTRRR